MVDIVWEADAVDYLAKRILEIESDIRLRAVEEARIRASSHIVTVEDVEMAIRLGYDL